MIMVVKRTKESIDEIIKFFQVAKINYEDGLINYTVKPCLVKGVLINEQIDIPFMIEENEYVIVVDFAVYIVKRDEKNDSPGAKYISINEHNFNCDKIIKELKELL